MVDCRQIDRTCERCNDKNKTGHEKVQVATGTRRPTWRTKLDPRECLPLRRNSGRGHASSVDGAYNPPILRGIASRLAAEVKRDVIYAVDHHLRKRAMWAPSDLRSAGKASRRHPSRWNTCERKW